MKHGTPANVVKILSAYIPNGVKRILEPAVGKGALLSPLLSGAYKQLELIRAFDIDKKRLSLARSQFKGAGIPSCFEVVDFLSKNFGSESFDCVITNPPFDAKKSSFVEFEGKRVPIELAFLQKSVSLLKDSGRLIAIIPSSLIAGQGQQNQREKFLKQFTIIKVYELNQYTFPSIEGRFYLLVADKRISNRQIYFQKPFSNKEVVLKIPKKEIIENSSRLDFSYYFSYIQLQQLMEKPGLEWKALSDIAAIHRGSYSSPNIPKSVVHTTNYDSGLWASLNETNDNSGMLLAKNDILVKRVSRNCQDTFGLYCSNNPANFSDCVLRIRPKRGCNAMEILFSLRVIYSSPLGKELLIKGSGANYMTTSNLADLKIPVNLNARFSKEFNKYRKLYLSNNFSDAVPIEKQVYSQIFTQ